MLSKTVTLPFIKKSFPRLEIVCLIFIFITSFLGFFQFFGEMGTLFFASFVFMGIWVLLRRKIYFDIPFYITCIFSIFYFVVLCINGNFTTGWVVGALIQFPVLYQFGRALYDYENGKKLLFLFLLTSSIGLFTGMMLNIYSTIQEYGFEYADDVIIRFWNRNNIYSRTGLSLYLTPLFSLALGFLVKRNRYQNWLTITLAILIMIGATFATFYIGNRAFVLVEGILFIFVAFYVILKIKSFKMSVILSISFSAILIVGLLTFLGIGPLGEWFASTYIGSRFIGGGDSGRWSLYKLFFENFYKYPFGGLDKIIEYCHNLVLDFYTYGGIIPFICSTIFFIRYFVDYIRMFRLEMTSQTGWFLTFFTLLGMFLMGLFEPVYQANPYYMFFPFLAFVWMEGFMVKDYRLALAERKAMKLEEKKKQEQSAREALEGKKNKKFVIFLGNCLGDKLAPTFSSKYRKTESTLPNALYEKNIVLGLEKQEEWDHLFVSAPTTDTFPNLCKKIKFKEPDEGNDFKYATFSPLIGISHNSKANGLYQVMKDEIGKRKPERVMLVACEAYLPYMKAIMRTKRKFKSTRIDTCLIIPDLPKDIGARRNPIMKFLKNRYIKWSNSLMSQFDEYVLFNESMAAHIPQEKPRLISNGLIPNADPVATNPVTGRIVTVGAMNELNGISFLLEAAKHIKHRDFEMVFAGVGPMEEKIISKSKEDKRIRFEGYLPHEKALELEASASVLCCTRVPSEATSYSFPSKLIEMLRFPTPIVAFDAGYIPEAVKGCLLIPKEITAEALAESIDEALSNNKVNFNDRSEYLKTLLFENVFEWIVAQDKVPEK